MKNNQIIKTNKFISEHAFIARVVPMEIAKENPALVNLYCALILKSLKNMRSTKDLNDFNSMNYCSSINFIGRYFEDYLYIGFNIEYVNHKYLPNDYDALTEIIKIMEEAFYYVPTFSDHKIEKYKLELINHIKRKAKRPGYICYHNAFNQLDPTHRFNFNKLGTIKEAESLSREDLLSFHDKISKYPFSIVYQGENDVNQYERLMKSFPSDFELPIYQDIPFKLCDPIYGEEDFDTESTVIEVLYHFDMKYSLDNLNVMHILDNMIGGYNGILFNEIREKRGLCYSINSIICVSENIIEISTSVNKDKVEETLKSIEEIMTHFEDYFLTEDMERSRMDCLSRLIERTDGPNDIFEHNIVTLYKRNFIDKFDEQVASLYAVKKDDILKLAKSLKRVSTYVVKGK